MPRSSASQQACFSWSYTATPPTPGSLNTARPTQGGAGRPRAASHLRRTRPAARREGPGTRKETPRDTTSGCPFRDTTRGAQPEAHRLGPRRPRLSPAPKWPGSRCGTSAHHDPREPLPQEAPTERRRPRAGYCPPPSRPRPQKVSLPGPHRSLSLRRRERQPRRPTAPRERAPPTNTRRREAGPRGPPARLSGGSASRRAGSAPRLPPRPRGTPLTGNPPLPSPAPGAGRASPLPASRQPEPDRGSRQAPSGAAGRRLGRPLRPRPPLRPPPLLPGP